MENKKVLITGGNSGIGLAAIKCLAADGFATIAIGLGDSSLLEATGSDFLPCDTILGMMTQLPNIDK